MATASYPVEPIVGNDCGLFYNSSLYDTPAWVLIDECGEVNLSDWNVSEAEIVTRASDWAVALAAKFRAAIEFQYLWGANWTVLNWLRMAYMDRIRMDVLFMDRDDLAGMEPYAQGLRMPCQLRQFPINQPNEEAVKVDTCRLSPTYARTAQDGTGVRIEPEWVYSDGLGDIGDDPPVPPPLVTAERLASQKHMQRADAFGGMGYPATGLYEQMLMDRRAKSYPIMAEVPAEVTFGTRHQPIQPLPPKYPVFIPAVVALEQGYTDLPDKTFQVLDALKVKYKKPGKAKTS